MNTTKARNAGSIIFLAYIGKLKKNYPRYEKQISYWQATNIP